MKAIQAAQIEIRKRFKFQFCLLLFFTAVEIFEVSCARYNNNNNNRMPMAGSMSHAPNSQMQHVESHESQKVRLAMSTDMQNYMNLSVDPCIDFYEYACGNWGNIHSRQLRGAGQAVTAQHLVETRIVDQLQELLTLPIPPQHHPNEYSAAGAANVRKVRGFYDSCIAVEANGSQRRQFLMKILRENGGLRNVPNSHWQQNYHWLQMLSALRRNYGLDILIGMDVDLNLQQMRGNSVYLGEPRLTIIPEEYCSAMATRQSNLNDEIYNQVQQEVADNMRNWFEMESGEAARFGGDIVRFEFELCKRMREQQSIEREREPTPQEAPVYGGRSRTGQERLRQQPSTAYPRMTLAELTIKLGNSLDFKLYVEQILESGFAEYVYLRSQSYLMHLVRTVKANNRYTISGYILYRALLELDQPPALAQAQFMRRPSQCVRVLQRLFPQVLGDMYQRHVQRDDAQADMEQVFSDVVKAFEQLLKVDWLDDNDRRSARSRLAQYHTQLPDYQGVDLAELHFQKTDDYYRKLETTLRFNAREQFNALNGNDFNQNSGQDSASLDAFEVRAALLPRQQTILVGWGLLQSPFYNYNYPKALKYALVGQRLASTLLLAFDDEGWNRHPQATAPWNELTLAGYRNVSECQRAQYSNYLWDQPNDFNNATRLRQIIAESSALNVAFNAYLSWLELVDHKLRPLLLRETLPELNFTNTQLFFIYFAQSRCWAKPGEKPPTEALPLMQHTPQRWDVNGPLSNSEEFGREFGCALGTHMNSGNKCLVY